MGNHVGGVKFAKSSLLISKNGKKWSILQNHPPPMLNIDLHPCFQDEANSKSACQPYNSNKNSLADYFFCNGK